MLVCEHLLVSRAEITDLLVMYRPDVFMQIRPSQTRNITILIWTIVSQQQSRIFPDIIVLVSNPDVIITTRDIRV
jgi:hypothetical protein